MREALQQDKADIVPTPIFYPLFIRELEKPSFNKKIIMWIFIIILVLAIIIIGAIMSSNAEKEKTEKRGNAISEKLNTLSAFEASVTIVGIKNMYSFNVDKKNKKIAYVTAMSKTVIPYEKIISVELVEDNLTLSSRSLMRTIGGTVVGGALAGGAGAVVGGLSGNQNQEKKVSKVQVKVRLRDISNSSLIINCFDAQSMTVEGKPIKPTSMEGYIYKQGLEHAKQICDVVSVIIDEVEHNIPTTVETSDSSSVIERIEKLAVLKEKGAINEDEYAQMKSSLMNGSSNDATINTGERRIIEVDEIPQEIKDAINNSQKILAVKLYMNFKGCSMREAKDFIDKYC